MSLSECIEKAVTGHDMFLCTDKKCRSYGKGEVAHHRQVDFVEPVPPILFLQFNRSVPINKQFKKADQAKSKPAANQQKKTRRAMELKYEKDPKPTPSKPSYSQQKSHTLITYDRDHVSVLGQDFSAVFILEHSGTGTGGHYFGYQKTQQGWKYVDDIKDSEPKEMDSVHIGDSCLRGLLLVRNDLFIGTFICLYLYHCSYSHNLVA